MLPSKLGLIGPYWASAEGSPIPLRVWNIDEWQNRPIDARYTAHGQKLRF